MKVRMHTTLAHPDYAATPGQVINLPDKVAKQLIADGYASKPDVEDSHRRHIPVDPPEPEAADQVPDELPAAIAALEAQQPEGPPDTAGPEVKPKRFGRK